MFPTPRSCPCGSGSAYDLCCGPLHRQERQAETPEELMRSRYSAYAVGEGDHLFRTWHPRTRPETITTDRGLDWTALEILDAPADDGSTGVVEFRALYRSADGPGVLHERSAFERRAGRWVYVEAIS